MKEQDIKDILYAWVREDAPTGMKMILTPDVLNKLSARLSKVIPSDVIITNEDREAAISTLVWAYERGHDLRDYKEAIEVLKIPVEVPPPSRAEVRVKDLTKCLRSLAEGNLGDGPGQYGYDTIKLVAANAISGIEPSTELTVWYGSMPESNGRENWTAIIRRVNPVDKWDQGFCFARSEYPDRVRYEADRMRWIIGELADKPDILAYDDTLHSGYVEPSRA